jgi:hypothetical protein
MAKPASAFCCERKNGLLLNLLSPGQIKPSKQAARELFLWFVRPYSCRRVAC